MTSRLSAYLLAMSLSGNTATPDKYRAATAPWLSRSPALVEVLDKTWSDASRHNREVPRRHHQLDEIYSKVKVPVMHMTGTLDDSPIGDTAAEQRRLPYDHTSARHQYLVTFEGGDHMIFSGRRVNAARESSDTKFHELINAGATAFFDAYVRGDSTAADWLDSEKGLKQHLGAHAVLERK
ncbi:MAG: hypothetical protein ACR2IE_14780 [Candidatus Sumerlaeaceae bacterium]